MKKLVLYHGNCFDGFASAYVAQSAFAQMQDGATTIFIPVFYNQDPPYQWMDSETEIYIVDFSYPEDVMLKMIDNFASKVVLLDHHEPMFKNLTNLAAMCAARDPRVDKLHMTLDGKRSGVGLAWDYFFPECEMPLMLQHVEDRDLWSFKLDNTRAFMTNLMSWPMDFCVWADIRQEILGKSVEGSMDSDFTGYENFVREGHAQLRAYDQLIETLLQKPLLVGEIDGYTVAAVGADYAFASELGNRLCEKYDIAIIHSFNPESKKYGMSLRAEKTKDVDVASIASKYFNGGGHKPAAGGYTVENIFVTEDVGTVFTNKRIERFYDDTN